MTKSSQQQKGIGFISIIVISAVIFALLNVYAYYNPDFSLSKYSPLNYLKAKRDEIRISDLKRLEQAVLTYFEDNNQLPASDGWCGRYSTVLHPEFATQMRPYLEKQELLHDPIHSNTNQDYFYYRVDKRHYILMAALEIPPEGSAGKYNYTGCHDWPGDDIYNYQLTNLEEDL